MPKNWNELAFRMEELQTDRQRLARLLGYDGDELPEPFSTYLEQAQTQCASLTGIQGAFRIVDDVEMTGNTVLADGLQFKTGKTVRKELEGAEKLAFFVCTAGKTISEKSAALLTGEDPVLGYVYDVLGSEIVEAVAGKIQQIIQSEVQKEGLKITNRYSPGYCHWSVADQHHLFALLGGNPCGVSLTESALMNPVKSVSGVIGIGRRVVFHDYQCALCTMKNCAYRKSI